MERTARITRKTSETKIELELTVDGRGESKISTSIPFLDHMLSLLAKHGLFDLEIKAKGDIEVDFHHTVEDIGICLGEALKKALGKKEGIKRFGSASIPMMESLANVSLDLSDRSHLVYQVELPPSKIGEFDTELVEEFFRSLCNNGGINLHISVGSAGNMHHVVEAVFKAFARALDEATQIDSRRQGIPSTKGRLLE